MRDRRDRYDRIYLKNLDAMHVIMPYVMPKRCDNEAVLSETFDITAINDFLKKKNAGNPEFKYTWFHVIAAALAKMIVLYPKMNWFISGYRMYERRDISICAIVRRSLKEESEEAVAKIIIDKDGGSPLEQVHSYLQEFITKVRVRNEVEGTTDKMNVLKVLPRPILRFVFWALRKLEYFGLYPASLAADDPCYSSVFITNLGSIKMHANYHHLYESGTISFFVVIDEKKMSPIFNPDGTYEMKDTIRLGFTVDERIADGFYFGKCLKMLNHLLQHPELLELNTNEPINNEN